MSWPLTLLIALLAGIVATGCMVLVTCGWVDWYRISSREGASGYFVIYISLLGGFIGALVGAVVARKMGPGFGTALLGAVGVNATICALLAGLGYLLAPKQQTTTPKPTQAVSDPGEERRNTEQAAFDAMRPDAPISEWFRFTGEGSQPEHRAAALDRIQAKPNYPEELIALLISTNRRTAVEALQIVRFLPKPLDPRVKNGVAACGRHLAELLRQVNATTPERDPHFELAGESSVRFSAWISVVGLLRAPQNGGAEDDFISELLEILQLSRQRPEIHTLNQDIRRVASYYAQKWGGIAPHPGDPPPK